MTLGERIRTIVKEKGISQVQFADEVGITVNYMNSIVNGRAKNISTRLAQVIEQKYGYSSEWILKETGTKYVYKNLTPMQVDIMKKVERMTKAEVAAVYTFANSLHSIVTAMKNEEMLEKLEKEALNKREEEKTES